MSTGSSIIDAAGGILDDVLWTPGSAVENIYAAQAEAAAKKEREKHFKLQQEEFDLTKKLSMQDYREKERQRKWQADFMRYLSQGMGGT